ncbi:endo-polygalacturonase PG1 [Sistotremastrum niveocremeum HHB9708]|uniref:endo-polygalacturonase n=1 Tax=Sistotremastrum niveocremeum HHB9708 TaxID=1314777 RepID=A0A164YGC6_9AGAM|nr:endo-polygalacturonase PG1 [Sistotremastrum niveocremeum HHB9708]
MLSLLSILLTAGISAVHGACTTGTISSLSDVSSAQGCATVNINGFTVPAGQGFTLSLANNAVVNLKGNILFGNQSWAGPLFTISGKNITFNGNGYLFDGGGPFYWDGQGSNGGVTKPRPMMKIKMSGVFQNTKIVNSPAQCFSVSNPAPLTISSVYIDNSQGDQPNANSGGLAAGHNTDGFDASTTDLTITGCTIKNQDDFLAINKGSNIVFTNNTCSGGHGVSIGSITSNVVVNGVIISNNHLSNADQALRIKTDAVATNSTVTNITYSGNTGTGLRQFGLLIDQSYPDTLGTPGTGVIISNVNFITSTTSLTVNSGAERVALNCGKGSCTGSWNWSYLKTSGGKAGPITNPPTISGSYQ